MVEAAKEDQGHKRALVVSISQYDNLAALEFCERDGNKICEVLTQLGYDIPIKYRLIGGRIEYDKLRDSILDFFYDKTIDPKDTVLFYFSGHGVLGDDGEHYLATSGIDPDNPYRRGFPFDGLTKARGECNSKMVFTVLDCCYSGADKLGKGSAKGSSKAQEESASVAKDTIKEKSSIPGEGKCVLAACKPMQKAFEYKEKGHSFFSYYLSEALTSQECIDKDGDVTPYALNTYIDNKIRSLPAEIRPKQNPFLNCSTAGKIVLAHYAKEVSPTAAATESKGSKSDYLLKLLQEEKIEEFNKIRKEGDVPLYLRKIDLRGKNLSGVDLHEADLSEAKLIGTKLITANLNGAKLRSVDLSGADLRTANLYGANLSGANLNRADLRGADLKGMIDFSGANLTGADIRGVDLTGMVNFSGAKLHDVDFTGSATDKGLINFDGADIRNAKGLPILHEPNEYLEALTSFSESIKQQFKIYNIAPEGFKPIEESVKELVEEVEGIQKPEQIDEVKKKNINLKLVDVAERVVKALPTREAETLRVFTPLIPFVKITGKEVPQIVESIQKNIDRTATHTEDHIEPPAQEQKTTGSPFYQAAASTEKESTTERVTKKPSLEANPPSSSPLPPKSNLVEDKKVPEYQYKAPTTYINRLPLQGSFPPSSTSVKEGKKHYRLLMPIIGAAVAAIIVLVLVSSNMLHQSAPPTSIQPAPSQNPNNAPPSTPTTNGYSFLTKWGSRGTADGQLNSPQGVAVDSSGNVYVADSNTSGRVQKFTSNGTLITNWGDNGTADRLFPYPQGVAVDSSGNVYVAAGGLDANAAAGFIQKFSNNGTFIRYLSDFHTILVSPQGVAVDSSGNVYVTDYLGFDFVQKFTSNGTLITKWGSEVNARQQFRHPTGVAVDSSGNVYVADRDYNEIQKFTSNGTFITKWGSRGTADGQLNSPQGVAVDSSGNVYVADSGNDRVQKFTSSGIFITKWGSRGNGDGQFSHPTGVAVDSSGNVYVADYYNSRIQVFSPTANNSTGK